MPLEPWGLLSGLPAVPVIVRYRRGRVREAVELLSQYSLTEKARKEIVRLFGGLAEALLGWAGVATADLFSMAFTTVPREAVDIIAGDAVVEAVYPDNPVRATGWLRPHCTGRFGPYVSTGQTRRLLGLDRAGEKGFDGSRVYLGIIDTGDPAYHPQLGLKGLSYRYSTAIPGQYTDVNGHGPHVHGIAAGRRASVGTPCGPAVVEGMAPGATVHMVKALGFGIGIGLTSFIVKALEILVKNRADVVNMSLGGPLAGRPEDDPLYHAVKTAHAYGVIVVAAAGNSGPSPGTIESPAAYREVLAVGALNPMTGEVAGFSSRGPTPWGDVKPDTVAPGVGILSASFGLLDAVDGSVNMYAALDGTSMASPHVAGLVAVMVQAHRVVLSRYLTLEEILRMLSELGHEKTNDDGYGMITWGMYEKWVSTQYGVEI